MDHLNAPKQLRGLLSHPGCVPPQDKRSTSANPKCPFEEGRKDQSLISSCKSSCSASPAGLVLYILPLPCWRQTLALLCFVSARCFSLWELDLAETLSRV